MSSAGGKGLVLLFVGAVSFYTGTKFWKPLIIDTLEKQGTLREDVDIGYVDREQPQSWKDLATRVKQTLSSDDPSSTIANSNNTNNISQDSVQQQIQTPKKED
ncbi:uncharacterized protein J8A68_005470 [[Candida] subhashii]|uniref:Protein ECM19 n=1 Tax=[Candida] subhashii TaxID=561895 RepID=A0A8J5USV0_9ASCO|nr:uncharacterized protein J8A68_005470 [[Candida] subhashii]KAG7660950.1 hypothetical protein J8A68_005470 [[Candida] subhashii]